MEKIWLKTYPAGVPADIDPDEYRVAEGRCSSELREVRRPAGLTSRWAAR